MSKMKDHKARLENSLEPWTLYDHLTHLYALIHKRYPSAWRFDRLNDIAADLDRMQPDWRHAFLSSGMEIKENCPDTCWICEADRAAAIDEFQEQHNENSGEETGAATLTANGMREALEDGSIELSEETPTDTSAYYSAGEIDGDLMSAQYDE